VEDRTTIWTCCCPSRRRNTSELQTCIWSTQTQHKLSSKLFHKLNKPVFFFFYSKWEVYHKSDRGRWAARTVEGVACACACACVCPLVNASDMRRRSKWNRHTTRRAQANCKTHKKTNRGKVVWLLAWDPSESRASMTLNWRGSVRSEREGKTRRHFGKELDWVILPQVWILTERGRASVPYATCLWLIPRITPRMEIPELTRPTYFRVKLMKSRIYSTGLCNHSSNSTRQVQHARQMSHL